MKTKTAIAMLGLVVGISALTTLKVNAKPASADQSITLRSWEGSYVRTDGNDGSILADSGSAGDWEHFALIDLDGGDLLDGDAVAFRANNGAYLQAVDSGGGALVAAGGGIGPWETFRIYAVDNPGGAVQSGSAVAILANNGASFVFAENGGGSTVSAAGSNSGGFSKFQIVF